MPTNTELIIILTLRNLKGKQKEKVSYVMKAKKLILNECQIQTLSECIQ